MPRTRNDHLQMMSDPFKWPMMLLPLKHRERQETGFLTGEGPIVYLGNIYDPLARDGAKMEYESFDAVVDDGWVVD